MIKFVLIAMFSGVVSAFSQVLLKKSSMNSTQTGLKEYLNPYVIGGYALVALCMIMMIAAYKGLPFKYGAAIEALVYFYIMIFGRIFFKERLTVRRVVGNLIIVFGVAIFAL